MESARTKTTVTRSELIAWNALVLLLAALLVLWTTGLPRAEGANAAPETAQTESTPVPEYTFTSPTNWAFLATGFNFPDALGVSSAAGSALGPILLVAQNSIPAPALAELDRLEPEHVRIIGGSAVISDAVLTQVQNLPYTTDVQRIAGADRFATAAEVSKAFFPTTGYYPRAGFFSSSDVADATGSPLTVLDLGTFFTGNGVLLIDAGIDVTTTSAQDVVCWIEIDDVPVLGSDRYVTVDGEGICSTEAADVVGEGGHTVEFVVDAANGVALTFGTLWAIHTPFQQDGSLISP